MAIVGPPLERPVDMAAILRPGLAAHPDAEAVVSRRRRWTWRALDEAAARLASAYRARGLAPGDRIASLMPNRGELIVHYLACMKAGLVAVPLNYRYMAPEIDHALDVSGARMLLAHRERDADLATSEGAARLPLGRIVHDDDPAESPLEAVIAGARPVDFAPPGPDDPAIIFFTSGSTGRPKGVCHTFATLGWIMASAIESLELGRGEVMLPGGSISHVGRTTFRWRRWPSADASCCRAPSIPARS